VSIKFKITSIESARGIALGFGLILIIILFLAVTAIYRFMQMQSDFETVVDTYNVRVILVHHMRILARERTPLLFTLVESDDPFEVEELDDQLTRLGSQYMTTRAQLIKTNLDVDEMHHLELHREAARIITPIQREIINLMKQGDPENAKRLLLKHASPLQVKALQNLDNLLILEQEKSKISIEKARSNFQKTLIFLVIASILGTILCITIGLFVSIRFSRLLALLKKTNKSLESKVNQRTSQLQGLNKKLEELANYDSLTKIPNRNLFIELLSQGIKLSKRNNTSTGLLFIDLDGFKKVNDDFGHDYGDKLLVQVASRLKQSARDVDVIARLGGDEFTVILTDVADSHAAAQVAERIVNNIKKPYKIEEQLIIIGSSIGVALYPQHADNLDDLIKMADEAMYQVKNSGKNNYIVAESS
jgi:diguanylate cyclase (GGDEF)-like protein